MMKAVGLALAVLASGTIVAMAQGVIIEVPGVKVTPPRVDIERRDRPIVEERRRDRRTWAAWRLQVQECHEK
jgi:hypothetical protein